MIHTRSRRWYTGLALLIVVAMLAAWFALAQTGRAGAAGESASAAAAYAYSFATVDAPHVRGKAQWSGSDNVGCGGGAQLPDGQVIVASGVDIGARSFVLWLYPGDQRLTIKQQDVIVDNAPPNGGWGQWDTYRPFKACPILHSARTNAYRVKLMFVSWNGDGRGYSLGLLDTGIDLVATPR